MINVRNSFNLTLDRLNALSKHELLQNIVDNFKEIKLQRSINKLLEQCETHDIVNSTTQLHNLLKDLVTQQ